MDRLGQWMKHGVQARECDRSKKAKLNFARLFEAAQALVDSVTAPQASIQVLEDANAEAARTFKVAASKKVVEHHRESHRQVARKSALDMLEPLRYPKSR